MTNVLNGDLVLKRHQKDKLKNVRDGIRKIVYDDEDLENHLDKDMENAIKLILNISNVTFPPWEKINASEDESAESSGNEPTSDDRESESETDN